VWGFVLPFCFNNPHLRTLDVNDYRNVYINNAMFIDQPSPLEDGGNQYHFAGVGPTYLGGVTFQTPSPMIGYLDEVMIFPRRLSRSQISLLYQNIPLPNGATSCSQLASRAYPPAFYPFPGSGFGPFTSGTSGSTYCNFNSTAVAPLPYAMPYGIGLAPMFYYTFDGTLADSVGGTSITLPAQSITVGTSYTTGVSGQALVSGEAGGGR